MSVGGTKGITASVLTIFDTIITLFYFSLEFTVDLSGGGSLIRV